MEDVTPVSALFVTSDDVATLTGPTVFDGSAFHTEPISNIRTINDLKGGATRTKALVIDSESISKGCFNPSVVHNTKVSGCDVWLVETIRDMGDLADAFLGYMSKLVFPVHLLTDDLTSEDVYASSDSAIPLIVCTRGRPIGGGDILGNTDSLRSEGFANVIVMDCDGTVSDLVWSEIDTMGGVGIFSPARQSDYTDGASIRFRLFGDYSLQ